MRDKNKNGIKRKMKRKNALLKLKVVAMFFLFCLSLSAVTAQTSVTATGGNASGSGGSASYSVGQVVYTTNSGTNGSVAQGVQQPYEISEITGIEEAEGIILFVTAYPNPTNDYLTLEVVDFQLFSFTFSLYDMNGKLLQSEKITDAQTNIDMCNLVPATYFVKVVQGNKEVKNFKIIKN